MKKFALTIAAVSYAVCLSANGAALALSTDDDKTKSESYRPVEFSAEVGLDEYKNRATKLDVNVVEKLDKAKRDMSKVLGSLKLSAVR